VDLVATYWTVAGAVRPNDPSEVSPWSFEDRVAAAAAAGFTGFGILHQDLVATRNRIGLGAMKAVLDDHGMTTVELEVLLDWFAYGPRRQISDAMWHDFASAAQMLGPRHVKVGGDMSGAVWPTDMMTSEFAALCTRAAEVGTSIVLEPMPFSSIPDLRNALEVIGDTTNGALLLDIWHVARGGISLKDIAALGPHVLGYVELDDASTNVAGTLWEDTVDNRLLCGEGDLDIEGFLRAVAAAGYDGPYGVEIISSAHRRRSLREAATLAYDTAHTALGHAFT
jgi:sugar phosphate isomerase/epimerase